MQPRPHLSARRHSTRGVLTGRSHAGRRLLGLDQAEHAAGPVSKAALARRKLAGRGEIGLGTDSRPDRRIRRWGMSAVVTLTSAPPRTGSGLKRFLTVMSSDFLYQARRPATLIWIMVLVLCAWGMSQGAVRIQSGDATVG